jgi:TonB-dependent starch-binding outer membrane protein SusC
MRLLCRSLPKGAGIHLLLLLLLSPLFTLAQSSLISGTVTDSTGKPLAGISVSVKGKKNVLTVTKSDGTFSIPAETGETLVFSGISVEDKELLIGTQTRYIIELHTSATVMSDVVVVGYGKSSRKTLSSSITTIKPDELNKGAIGDVGQLLQGKVPGLNITASGDPNRSAAVILRGASTVNSPGAPFYVIDGIPGADIATVAPDDIASIDILKDAAATAIYGNRAASGVIMITTKKGKKGQPSTSYSGYVGLEKVSNNLDLMNADQLRAYLTANGSGFSPNDDKGANVDWQKAIQRNDAISHNHNLSYSGGGEHSTYSASINYLDKQGILNGSRMQRVIARLSLEQSALNDHLKFGLNVANSNTNSNYVPLQNIVLLQAAKRLPVNPIKNANGTYFENLNNTGYFNPVAMMNNADDDTKYNMLIGNFTTELKLPFGFTLNNNISYQKTTSLHGEYYGSYYSQYPTSNFYNNPDPGIGISHTLIGNLFGTNGSAIRNTYQNTTKTLETFLTWNKKIGLHNINAVVGYSWQENIYGEGFQTSSTNFPADNIGYSNLALGNPYALSSYRISPGNDLTYGQIRLISDFARLNYSFNDKYLLQGSIRRDGSSVFGENNQWGYFPSVGVAWRIIQEDFMTAQNIFSDLKLRFSYGITGNSQGIGAYTSKTIYGYKDTYLSNGTWVAGYGPVQGANPDLQWEKTATTDVGLDFTILKGKLSGTLDWYNKKTTGMLFQYSVSSALVPGGRIWANGGSIENKGIELSLTATPVSNSVITWTSTLNVAHNKNVVTDLKSPFGNSDSTRYSDPEGPGQTGATLQILKVGKPLGQFFTLAYQGKNAAGDSSRFLTKDGKFTSVPGIGTNYFYEGDAQPRILMGWANTVKYKNFDLNVFFRGVFGNKIMNATRADLSYVAGAPTSNILNSAAGDKLKDKFNSFYSTRYLESGSYVRLDNATLGYNFAKPIKYVNNIRLYTTVNNVFTITDYSGIDPEINQGGVSPGIDYNNFYPKTRTFLFGVNVSF